MDFALSVKQPWAALLLLGLKTIEVRRWPTARRGRVLLHAGQIADPRPEGWRLLPAESRSLAELRGGIIGALTLQECRPYRTVQAFQTDQPWHHNDPSWFRPPVMYGFRFTDPAPLPFRACPGQVRFFSVDGEEFADQETGRQGDKETGRQGDKETEKPPVSLSPCLPVSRSPGLLVSVRSPEEVESALAGGADLIDAKEPQHGSLGRPDEATLNRIVESVAGRRPVSAALGELQRAVGLSLPPLVSRLAYVKWGLSGYRGNDLAWRMELSAAVEQLRRTLERSASEPPHIWGPQPAPQRGHADDVGHAETREDSRLGSACRFVAVAYADWERAGAPRPEVVAEYACSESAGALLLDTWHKDGTTLLDWLDVDRIGQLVQRCRSAGVPAALAGALGKTQIQTLLPVAPDWFAVRGAVCQGGRRVAAIDAGRVRELVEVLRATGR